MRIISQGTKLEDRDFKGSCFVCGTLFTAKGHELKITVVYSAFIDGASLPTEIKATCNCPLCNHNVNLEKTLILR